MEWSEKIRFKCVSITDCGNSYKCVLDTLQFVRVESGQTSDQKIAIVNTPTQQGFSHKACSLICQVPCIRLCI